jgi:hypothetical protein
VASYRTFQVTIKSDGNLWFVESERILDDDPTAATIQLMDDTDWQGEKTGVPVVAIGIELYPGLEYGWWIGSFQTKEELEQNRRDEDLQRLTGQGRVVGTPTVES